LTRISIKAIDIFAGELPQRLAAETSPGSTTDLELRLFDQTRRLCVDIRLIDSSVRRQLITDSGNGQLQLVIGDFSESGVSNSKTPCANATLIDIDFQTGTATVVSSLIGLPPVFYSRAQKSTTISCPFLPRTPKSTATPPLDIEGIADTLRWGHPLDGRTLFSDIRILAPHMAATIDLSSLFSLRDRASSYTSLVTPIRVDDIIARQSAALAEAAMRLPTDHSFLSLSGGLDSRTALVALLNANKQIKCVTLAGSDKSLDARLADRFCSAYGLQHQIIELGDDYLRNLPDAAIHSAALTGGVACLSQTIDLYIYKNLAESTAARISGNLGNQVGRGGVEGLSAYRVEQNLLSNELRAALDLRPLDPWFMTRMQNNQFGTVLFEQEVHYWSIANYSIGSNHALQLSPYADTQVIQLAKALYLQQPQFANPTTEEMRRRDLRHRLMGPPKESSFQRAFLIAHDKHGSHVPINWGWLARGGWSPGWAITAAVSAADAALIKFSGKSKRLEPSLRWMSARLGRPSALVAWRDVLRTQLRTLAHDVMLSAPVAQSGLFVEKELKRVLTEHFDRGIDHHQTVYRLLEISLGIHARHTNG
jgi:hypothetical protein